MSPEAILHEVAREFLVPVPELVGRRKWPHLTPARAELANRLYMETDLTLREIGMVMGGRHYRTVRYFLDRYDLSQPVAA